MDAVVVEQEMCPEWVGKINGPGTNENKINHTQKQVGLKIILNYISLIFPLSTFPLSNCGVRIGAIIFVIITLFVAIIHVFGVRLEVTFKVVKVIIKVRIAGRTVSWRTCRGTAAT